MAHGNNAIPIPGELISVATDGRAISADGVYDYNKNKFQETINAEVDTELGNKIPSSQKGAANGVATLDSGGKVPSTQLPSYVDDVLEYNSRAAFPATGEEGKIYVAKDTNISYRWSGSAYIAISNPYTPDEEDLTVTSNVIKFKDRPNTDGMGRIILRKGISLSQQMTQANTIYVIQYDFTLGEDITVPANCVLEFDGGSISGTYTITGTNTGISAGLVKIFGSDVTLAGTWNVSEAYPEWFGANAVNTFNSTQALAALLRSPFEKVIFNGIYYISHPIYLGYGKTLLGKNGYFRNCGISANDDFAGMTINGVEVNSFFYITSTYYAPDIRDLSFNANYKCDTFIDFLNNRTQIAYSRCSFERFYGAAVIVPGSDSSIINECRFKFNYVSIFAANKKFNIVDPLSPTGTSVWNPNHFAINNCNIMLGTYGIIVFNSSDCSLDNNLFGYNSLMPIYIDDTRNVSINNLYIEGDYTCQYKIVKNMQADPSNEGHYDDVSAEVSELVPLNRAYIVLSNANCIISRPHISNWNIRSYQGSTIERRTDATKAGIDGLIKLVAGASLSIDTYEESQHTVIGGNNVVPLYDVLIDRIYSDGDSHLYSEKILKIHEIADNLFYNNVPTPLFLEESQSDLLLGSNVRNKALSSNGAELTYDFNEQFGYAESVNGTELFSLTGYYPEYGNSMVIDANTLKNKLYKAVVFVKSLDDSVNNIFGFNLAVMYSDGSISRYTKVQTQKVIGVKKISAYFTPYDFEKDGVTVSKIYICMHKPNDSAAKYECSSLFLYSVGDNNAVTLVATSGSTNPSMATTNSGRLFYNTASHKPLWWDGTAWVDATGTTV